MHRINLLKLFLLPLVGAKIASCYSQTSKEEIRCINIVDSTQIFGLQKGQTPFELNISFNVYYYNDMVLYRYFYNFDSSVNGKHVFSEERLSYFVHHKDSAYGRYYNSRPESIIVDNRRLHLDSIHKKRDGYTYDTLMARTPDSVYWSADGQVLYEISNRSGEKPPYIYYTAYTRKLNDIDQSYSKKMDSSRKMKLFKIAYVMQEGYSDRYKTNLPRMEGYNEMKEIPVTNKEEGMIYFRKYEKECLKR